MKRQQKHFVELLHPNRADIGDNTQTGCSRLTVVLSANKFAITRHRELVAPSPSPFRHPTSPSSSPAPRASTHPQCKPRARAAMPKMTQRASHLHRRRRHRSLRARRPFCLQASDIFEVFCGRTRHTSATRGGWAGRTVDSGSDVLRTDGQSVAPSQQSRRWPTDRERQRAWAVAWVDESSYIRSRWSWE
ncbi:hypothetical protein K402DRAFT_269475 [Aulographum hederae CBS 113979]|uniref:Uncharacterized protein n=1 Tax=Aulographum hederae CBS 113979 TaxID=1176131 RepID=A0A6G1H8G1_9PEZI|nr:hypothetical protein K402DRAFT_269475 [Aulographum hederae CBS 113979]